MSAIGLRPGLVGLFALAACSPKPDDILVELSPDVISSIDGTTEVTALVVGDRTPLDGEQVAVAITYTDRNGTPHDIAPIEGTTDARGAFHATISGLTWDGVGEVTVSLPGEDVAGAASFAVLDRTPPAVEILPPTTDLRVGPGLPLEVVVHVTDEIGVSEVVLEANGDIVRRSRTVIASGSADANITFQLGIPDNAQAGPTIVLHALAGDLSGNLAASDPLTLTVDPAITIATPPGLTGSLVTDGTLQDLADPRALVVSPHDGAIYVADNAQNAPCNGACIRKVDPATGAVDATVVVTGVGELEGVALDALGDNLYYSDRQNRIGRLTWNGTIYTGAVACNNAGAQSPQDPYHLVYDATLGILSADGGQKELDQIATCAPGSVGTDFSAGNFDQPRGVALGAGGEIYISDNGRDQVYTIDRATGAATLYETGLDQPYGLEWLGGTSAWADSLLVANSGGRMVVSTTGSGTRAAAYLRNAPIDLALAGGTLYILTGPSANNRGRIYKVTGF